jgi:hypothetical protein
LCYAAGYWDAACLLLQQCVAHNYRAACACTSLSRRASPCVA